MLGFSLFFRLSAPLRRFIIFFNDFPTHRSPFFCHSSLFQQTFGVFVLGLNKKLHSPLALKGLVTAHRCVKMQSVYFFSCGSGTSYRGCKGTVALSERERRRREEICVSQHRRLPCSPNCDMTWPLALAGAAAR